jgi:hypothetical protein
MELFFGNDGQQTLGETHSELHFPGIQRQTAPASRPVSGTSALLLGAEGTQLYGLPVLWAPGRHRVVRQPTLLPNVFFFFFFFGSKSNSKVH